MLGLKLNHVSKRGHLALCMVISSHSIDCEALICLCLPQSSISTTYTTVYPKKYARGFCFAVLCCGYTLTDFPISIRLTSLALWQSNDCPSASEVSLMDMDKCEFIMNDCITTTKQSTTKPCAYFLGYTVYQTCKMNKTEHEILCSTNKFGLTRVTNTTPTNCLLWVLILQKANIS